jgi:hypothetical protein
MPNGEGLVFVFRADGTYTKVFQSYVSTGSCTTGLSAFESGVANASGDGLVTTPSTGKIVFSDTCAPSLDREKPEADPATESFTWSFDGPTLVLVRSDGVTGRFRAL